MPQIALSTDSNPDPNAAPRADITETATGVQVDPTKTSPPAEKPAAGDRPAWLDEKFKTPEDLQKAYTELQKKLGTPAEKPAETPAAPAAITADAATKAGIDMNALAAEFAKDGKLSDETLKSLKEKGFDKATVDTFIAGQKAIAEKLQSEYAEIAGGKDKLDGALEWAKANLSETERNAFDAALDSGNPDLAKLALRGLLAQHTEATGTDPQLINGEQVVSGDIQAFQSNAEVVQAMRDPRYKTDSAYRAKVAQRLSVSNTFGSVSTVNATR